MWPQFSRIPFALSKHHWLNKGKKLCVPLGYPRKGKGYLVTHCKPQCFQVFFFLFFFRDLSKIILLGLWISDTLPFIQIISFCHLKDHEELFKTKILKWLRVKNILKTEEKTANNSMHSSATRASQSTSSGGFRLFLTQRWLQPSNSQRMYLTY